MPKVDGRSGKLPPLDSVNMSVDDRKRSLGSIGKHNNSITEGANIKKVNSSSSIN